MENKKTALIIEGGGQRGVFSFGITDTFISRNYDHLIFILVFQMVLFFAGI